MKKRVLCLFFVTILMFSSFGCNKISEKTIVYEDTKIEYSSLTFSKAQNSIFDLLKSVLKSKNQATLTEMSKNVCDILTTKNVPESEFVELIDFISQNNDKLVDDYNKISNGEVVEDSILDELLDKMILSYKVKGLSDAMFEVFEYIYNYKIVNHTVEERKKQLRAERDTFLSISEETFYNLIKSTIMVKNLLEFNSGDVDLTNSEIVMFLSKFKFSVNLTNEQWKVVIKNIYSLPFEFGEIAKKIYNNNEYTTVGNMLNNLFSLLDLKTKDIDENLVNDYLSKDKEKVIETFVLSLNSKEKLLLEETLNVKLNADYLDYFDAELKDEIISCTNKTVSDLFTCNIGEYYDTFLGTIRNIFYD